MEVDLGCPLCSAPPGTFCVTPAGRARSDHKAREYRHEHEYGEPEWDMLAKRYKRYCECGSFEATKGAA